MITQYTIPVQNCQLHSAERAVIIEKNVNRKGKPTMNVLRGLPRFQDISGFGRCSTTVVLPVLAAMAGMLPAAYRLPLRPHRVSGQREGHLSGSDRPDGGTAAHWAELGVTFDAIYSGFLGSAGQIGLIEDFYRQFRREGTLVLVDPVMGTTGSPTAPTRRSCAGVCGIWRPRRT